MRLPNVTRPRRAWVSIWALLVLMAMLAALAVAANAAWLATGRQELQSSADAAALAGSRQLVSDEWLRLNQPGVPDLLNTIPTTARDYAGLNFALGRRVELLLPDDVELGGVGSNGEFVPAPANPTLIQSDVVRVAARRLRSRNTAVPLLLGALVLTPAVDLQALASSRLDRDVVGFQAYAGRNIPIVPLGIQSDPAATLPTSWENRIVARNGLDLFAFDPATGFTLAPSGDGIPEIDVILPLAPLGALATGNGYLLHLGTGSPPAQVRDGVSDSDLSTQQGRLILAADNLLRVPAETGPAFASADYATLRDNLEHLRRERLPRIFPLVAGVSPTGEARVNAFVAARVVRIVETPGGPLVVRLQPTMLAVPQAITDASRRSTAHLLPSAYLGKPRLVR